MTDSAHSHKHPFALEALYRETAATTTDGDLSDPTKALKPLIDLYHQQRESILETLDEETKNKIEGKLDTETEDAWWKLMPYFLPPKRANHEFALVYSLYRVMTTGNMAFMIGPDLSTALHNTDFKVKMDQLAFPSDTFVIYYKDSSIPVFGSSLKWLMCDRVTLGNLKELRIVYGYIDKDGDYANSGFQLYTYQPDIESVGIRKR